MNIRLKGFFIFVAYVLIVGIALFVPAGTLDFWQAWLYMAILFIPMASVLIYFLARDPEFLRRRFEYKEKNERQKKIVSLTSLIYAIAFLLPGLDHRFGWSQVPTEAVILADALILLGYLIIILVFRENRYAARTVRVEQGQKVITTGPYSLIRHPMYLGVLIMYLSTPIALGSYWAFIPMLGIIPGIVLRIKNEEEVLLRELDGYREYCKKTRYRLIPFLW
jgi:protein-S-isoprenylcysteine O-methyltransferase Ste14